jgi:hypothetical protein
MNLNEPTPSRAPRVGLGVLLRRLAGVQESTLDTVPGERARYTSMGGVVLGTAAIATISIGVAMYTVFGTWASPVAIVFTALWGLFILNLDRWLMSTVVERDGWARVVRFLPRILLAVIFGVIIAEPLLLGVYDSAIVKHIRDGRQHDVDQVEALLVRCNPKSGPAARPADCTSGNLLTVDVDPDATQDQLKTVTEQANKLRETVNRDKDRLDELTTKARQECAGDRGPGLTGQRGMGPECRQLYNQIDAYKRDNHTEENVKKLAQLDGSIEELSAKVQTERADYAKKIDTKIREKVHQTIGRQQTIGLMERLRAMNELVSSNGYVHATQWALRIFFIAVDSLPVLVKLLSGRTAYDRVAVGRLAREERAQQLAEGTRIYRDAVQAGVDRYRIDLDGAAERDRASVHARWLNRDTEDELRRLVDEGTDQMMDQVADLDQSGDRIP